MAPQQEVDVIELLSDDDEEVEENHREADNVSATRTSTLPVAGQPTGGANTSTRTINCGSTVTFTASEFHDNTNTNFNNNVKDKDNVNVNVNSEQVHHQADSKSGCTLPVRPHPSPHQSEKSVKLVPPPKKKKRRVISLDGIRSVATLTTLATAATTAATTTTNGHTNLQLVAKRQKSEQEKIATSATTPATREESLETISPESNGDHDNDDDSSSSSSSSGMSSCGNIARRPFVPMFNIKAMQLQIRTQWNDAFQEDLQTRDGRALLVQDIWRSQNPTVGSVQERFLFWPILEKLKKDVPLRHYKALTRLYGRIEEELLLEYLPRWEPMTINADAVMTDLGYPAQQQELEEQLGHNKSALGEEVWRVALQRAACKNAMPSCQDTVKEKLFKHAQTQKGRDELVELLRLWTNDTSKLLFPGLADHVPKSHYGHHEIVEEKVLRKELVGLADLALQEHDEAGSRQKLNDLVFQMNTKRIYKEQEECHRLRGFTEHPYRDEDYEFCCAKCRCSKKTPATGLNSVWTTLSLHRKCCHGLTDYDIPRGSWNSLGENAWYEKPCGIASKDEVEDATEEYYDEGADYRHALLGRQLRRAEADSQMPLFTWTAKTHEKHATNFANYTAMIEDPSFRPKKEGIVVVDFFAGHGTGLVALQKNGIRVKKYIVVEYDRIAVHVLRFNHDSKYRRELGLQPRGQFDEIDSIEFVFIENFEDVSLEALVQHGPIDLVIGSPPCVDYSRVNANRKGVDGESGNFHVRLGKLISSIQEHCETEATHLWFVVENVIVSGKDKDVLEMVMLLRPLQKVFESGTQYEGLQYEYPWKIPFHEVPAG